MPRITTEALFMSYGASLRAKVQLVEFRSFGGSVEEGFRQTIAAHQELEAQYLVQLKADRDAQTAALKAELDAFDKAQPPRRSRR